MRPPTEEQERFLDAANNPVFWAHQSAEHLDLVVLFMHRKTSESALIQETKRKWLHLRGRLSEGVKSLEQKNGKHIVSSYECPVQNAMFKDLARITLKIYKQVKGDIRAGKFDHLPAKLFSAIVSHMQLETRYAAKVVDGSVSKKEELAFWLAERSTEEAGTAAFVSEKKNPTTVEMLQARSKKLAECKGKENARSFAGMAVQLLKETFKTEKKVGARLGSHEIVNRLPKLLLAHEGREGRRMIQRIGTVRNA
jgi:hypothetical protein